MKSAHPFQYNLNGSSNKSSRPRGGTPGVPMVINQNPRMDSSFSDELAARLCREYTTECVETLVGHMRDMSNPQTSLAATNLILDRGYGKPKDMKVLNPEKGGDLPAYRVKIEFVDSPSMAAPAAPRVEVPAPEFEE